MKKTVLITGGAGFIGSRLALRLLGAGYEVRVLDSLTQQIHGDHVERSPLYRLIAGKVDFHHGCVTDRPMLANCLRGVDTVVHLAAETGTGQSMYEIQRYVNVNVGGTGILLDLLANTKHQVRKLVVASSRAIYGEGKYRCATHGMVHPAQRKTEDMEQGLFSPRETLDMMAGLFGVPKSERHTDEILEMVGLTEQAVRNAVWRQMIVM